MITGDLSGDNAADEPVGRGGSARSRSTKSRSTKSRTTKSRSGSDEVAEAAPADSLVEEELDEEQDEFADADEDEVSPDIDDLDTELDEDIIDDDGDEPGEDIDAVVELSSKEQSARSLEVRRAIEARIEKKKLDEDIDYLDLDFDD